MGSGLRRRRRLRARVVASLSGLLALVALMPQTIAAAPELVAVRTGIVYAATPEGELRLDAYRLRGRDRLPVLILVHGGSWRRGDRSDVGEQAKAFARAGFLVLAPDYRLAPPGGTTTFPGPVRDLRRALRWARHNARALEGDPRRVALVGTSAGAHLTLLLASTGRTRPDAVGLYSPPVDLAAMHRAGVATESIEAFLGCSPDTCADDYKRASPLFQVDRRTSPAFLVYSSDEVLPVEQGRRLDRRLRQLAIRHRTHEVEGTAHGFAAGRRLFDEAVRFLKRSISDGA